MSTLCINCIVLNMKMLAYKGEFKDVQYTLGCNRQSVLWVINHWLMVRLPAGLFLGVINHWLMVRLDAGKIKGGQPCVSNPLIGRNLSLDYIIFS